MNSVKRFFFTALILPCLLLLASAAPAAAESLEEQVGGIEQYYSSLRSLRFNFQQLSHSGGSQRVGKGSGVLYKDRSHDPGKVRGMMRWDYQEPEPQVIVSDGETIAVYSPADRQMLVSSAAGLETDILYRLFLREQDQLGDFNVAWSAPEQAGTVGELRKLRLEPRLPHPQIREVVLWFDHGYRIQRLRMLDQFGGETSLILDQIRENPLADSSPEQIRALFQLTPPEGTEIIRN
ncbi:MAG: hypothetical protein BWK76_25495 [Desulfobulbaceae bacterium A2]|nr:MAG: hypothetical protein BWK76_25495 [Desulfobulbaceae bacterium A2]